MFVGVKMYFTKVISKLLCWQNLAIIKKTLMALQQHLLNAVVNSDDCFLWFRLAYCIHEGSPRALIVVVFAIFKERREGEMLDDRGMVMEEEGILFVWSLGEGQMLRLMRACMVVCVVVVVFLGPSFRVLII